MKDLIWIWFDLGTKLQIFHDSIVVQFPDQNWAQREPNQIRKMTRKPRSHISNVGYKNLSPETFESFDNLNDVESELRWNLKKHEWTF